MSTLLSAITAYLGLAGELRWSVLGTVCGRRHRTPIFRMSACLATWLAGLSKRKGRPDKHGIHEGGLAPTPLLCYVRPRDPTTGDTHNVRHELLLRSFHRQAKRLPLTSIFSYPSTGSYPPLEAASRWCTRNGPGILGRLHLR